MDWTQASASAQYTSVTVVADSLSIASVPSVVRLNQDITVHFDYTANPGATKHVYMSILQSNTWDWIGGTNVALAAGTGTRAVTFRLDHAATNTAPYPYVYSAFIAPADGGFSNATALAGMRPVSVVVERVWFVSATSTVENGRTYDIRIGHQLESNGYVKVDLLKPGAPVGQDWFGGTGVVALAGTGTSTLSLTVSGHPPAGGGYQWSAFVGPTLEYSNSTASAQSNNITVVADSLSIASAPAVVSPGQTVSVTLNYTANPGLQKHVQVSLLAPNQGYAWYGGASQAVASGSGQVTVQFTVEGQPPSGSDYVIDAFLAPDGLQWDGATAATQQPVTVHSDAISFYSYPPSIWTPQTWDVQIAYTVWDTRIIQVNLLTPAPDYTYRAHGVVTVGPGSGVATVSVNVASTFDSGPHIWSAFAAPEGGSWETRTANAASDEIWVTRDPVKIVSAPTNVQRGATVNVTLSWEVLQNSEIHIDLIRDGTYDWYGGAWATIGAGTGTGVLSVAVNPSAPIGTNYIWSSWVGPVGQGYANRTADEAIQNITVRP
jgi:hypothetical protein